ncbi:MAG: hypothetical protein IJ766_01445 [Clostridia bacterium]|nr:hypothetical protein [Clostridia bacterium]
MRSRIITLCVITALVLAILSGCGTVSNRGAKQKFIDDTQMLSFLAGVWKANGAGDYLLINGNGQALQLSEREIDTYSAGRAGKKVYTDYRDYLASFTWNAVACDVKTNTFTINAGDNIQISENGTLFQGENRYTNLSGDIDSQNNLKEYFENAFKSFLIDLCPTYEEFLEKLQNSYVVSNINTFYKDDGTIQTNLEASSEHIYITYKNSTHRIIKVGVVLGADHLSASNRCDLVLDKLFLFTEDVPGGVTNIINLTEALSANGSKRNGITYSYSETHATQRLANISASAAIDENYKIDS